MQETCNSQQLYWDEKGNTTLCQAITGKQTCYKIMATYKAKYSTLLFFCNTCHHNNWLNSPLWALAFFKRSNQAALIFAMDLQFLILIVLKWESKQSTHLFFDLPLGRCPKGTVLKTLYHIPFS